MPAAAGWGTVALMKAVVRFRCAVCAITVWVAMLASSGLAFAQDDGFVDLELVLAVDVSRSMDSGELALQRFGYADAFRHPSVVSAIASGPNGRIAVTYVEWAGPDVQQVIVPWFLVDGADAARAFADSLTFGALGSRRGTSISGGLLFAATLFQENSFTGLRRVIDLSGDGPNNMGLPVVAARDAVVAQGIVINGLPLTLKRPTDRFYNIENLDIYYEDCAIGAPGAFLVAAHDPAGLAAAIRRKLVLEIAGRPPVITFANSRDRPPPCRLPDRRETAAAAVPLHGVRAIVCASLG